MLGEGLDETSLLTASRMSWQAEPQPRKVQRTRHEESQQLATSFHL